MPRSHDYQVRTFRIQIFLRELQAFCNPSVQGLVSSTLEHIAYLGGARLHENKKNAEQRKTGDKHQVPSHSTRGHKRTAKDRYKLPVGLLKRITLPYRYPLEPLDSQGNKGKISTGVFFNAKTSVF